MAPTHAPNPHVLAPGTAPTPFTADEIRSACPTGRTAVLAVTDAEGRVHHRLSRFVDCDEDGATFERGACTPQGEAVGVLDAHRVSWLDLQGHASFPATAVTIEPDAVELPMGRLDCLRYTVVDADEITTYWFARSLPGMPVKVVGATSGRVQETTEMVANLLP